MKTGLLLRREGLKTLPQFLPDGDGTHERIGALEAKEEAAKWLGSLKLGRDLFGQTVDLSQKGDTLPFTGEFRRMVLEAARRKLVKRKAKDIILPL